MKKFLTALLLSSAVLVLAGTWPDREQLLKVLVTHAPATLKSFRADSGEFGSKPWICNDQNVLFWLSVLWDTKSPENPYYRDAKLLQAIAKGGEKLVNEQDVNGMWIFRKKDNSTWGPIHMPWTYTRWIQAYLIVKDHLPPESRAMWEKGLLLGYKHIAPAINKGYTHNIAAYHAAGLYAAGIAFNNDEWKNFAKNFFARLVARQAEDGFWTEHYGPVVGYNMVYLQALGIYYYYSKDPIALEAMAKGNLFHAAVLWKNGSSASVIDERNPYSAGVRIGTIGFAFTPEGRWYMDKVTAIQPLHPDNAGHILYMGTPGETKSPITGNGSFLSKDKKFSMNTHGVWQWCISAYACKPNHSRWIMERQNHVEIYHEKFGLFAGGGNTRMQPYYSNFTFGDPDSLQPDYTTEKPKFLPDIPLQWYATQGELNGNTLDLTYGKNQTAITVTPEDKAINVDFALKNTPDKPAMAHLQLLRMTDIKSADGKLFPPEQKMVTGKELNGKLVIRTGLIAIVPDNAQIRRDVPAFYPYQKFGKGLAPRMVISIPLSAANPKARIRIEEVVPQFSTEMLWNGNMQRVRCNPVWGKECKAECKDGALVVSGKGGDKRSAYLVARIDIMPSKVNGKMLKLDFDSPNVGRRDNFYIKGKTADGKTVFSGLHYFGKTGKVTKSIAIPLPGCGNGFKHIAKQITASPDEEVTMLEFHYAIAALNGEREFSLKNIRLTPMEK
ncbi:MAG: hypothetical protein IJV89_02235 [Lentisphaeria bacterium]|nr:hypothetical protein [Lentisphaeria bacterium]